MSGIPFKLHLVNPFKGGEIGHSRINNMQTIDMGMCVAV